MVTVLKATVTWLASVAAMVATVLLSLSFLMTKSPVPRATPSLKRSTMSAPLPTLAASSAGVLAASAGPVLSVTLPPICTQLPMNFCCAAGRSLEAVEPPQVLSPLSCSSWTRVPWAVLCTSTMVSKLPPVPSRRASRSTSSSVGVLLAPSQRNRRKSFVTSALAAPEGPARIR